MALASALSTEDLLRLVLLKFLSQADIDDYATSASPVLGKFVSADSPRAINVDTTPT